MTILAAVDGSALHNPGPAGWCWYIDENQWAAGGWPEGTNNRGELTALLQLLWATAHLPQEQLHVLCDSQYVINSVTKWMPGWKRKGWKKSDGKPVLNVDILKQIDEAMVGRTVKLEWVKGHAGHELNEAADQRARAAATAYQRSVAPDSGPGLRGAPHHSKGAQPARSVPGARAPQSAQSAQNSGAQPSLFDLTEPKSAPPAADQNLQQRLEGAVSVLLGAARRYEHGSPRVLRTLLADAMFHGDSPFIPEELSTASISTQVVGTTGLAQLSGAGWQGLAVWDLSAEATLIAWYAG